MSECIKGLIKNLKLVPVIGEENMVQELPAEFNQVLEEQKKWNSRKSR